MSKYGDYTDRQRIFENLSYLRKDLDLSMKELAWLTMEVLSDMMSEGYDWYGEIEDE